MVAPTSYRWSMVSLMLANVSCDGVCVAQQAVAHKGEPSAKANPAPSPFSRSATQVRRQLRKSGVSQPVTQSHGLS